MVTALALFLWMVAAAALVGGAVMPGLVAGVAAFLAAGWAMKRRDDVEHFWGVAVVAAALVTVARVADALLH